MREGSVKPLLVAFGGGLALAAAMGIGRFIYTPILPFMNDALGLTGTEGGLIAAANFVGYLLGALAAAGTILRGNPRHWFLAGLAASAATTAAMALTHSVTAFALIRFAGGIASALVLVFSSSLILEQLAASGRSALSGLHFAGVGTGIAASATMVFLFGSAPEDWAVLWLAGGAFSLACLIGVMVLVPAAGQAPEKVATPAGPSRREQGAGGDLNRLVIAYGLFGFGYVITATFISTIVRESEAISALEPLVWLTVGLAAIPSVAFWNWIGRFAGNRGAFSLACLAEALGVALSVLTGGGIALLLAAALLGGTFVGVTALGLVEARRLRPEAPRRAIALMTASFGLGQVVGPALAGVGRDWSGSFAGPTLLAALALIAAAILAIPRKRT